MGKKVPGRMIPQHTRIVGEQRFLTGPNSRHDGENDPTGELEAAPNQSHIHKKWRARSSLPVAKTEGSGAFESWSIRLIEKKCLNAMDGCLVRGQTMEPLLQGWEDRC